MKSSIHIFTILVILATGVPIQAGTIRGTVEARVEGGPGGTSGDYGSRRYKFLERVDYSGFKDFVVSITGVETPQTKTTSKPVIEQKNGAFIPHVLPVVAGSEVEWPNRDDIFHNVFSISETRPFDLGYYKSKDDAKSIVFEKPGRVDVFCSIHSKMNCIVLVMPNPWFSTTNNRGRYEIKNVPAGTYRLKSWHERLPPKYREVTVPEEGVVEVDITMGLADLPKY